MADYQMMPPADASASLVRLSKATAPAPQPHDPQRNLRLDILRSVAIGLVLYCHSVFLREPSWDRPLWRIGWSGVDLFFVLSGFLISGLLFSEYRKTGTIHFKRFFVRRAFKIYPAFYALLLVTVVPGVISSPQNWTLWRPIVNDLLFLQSYRAGTWGHFWSLSVEEHFYLLLPLILWTMIRAGKGSPNPFQRLPFLFLAVAIATLAARVLTSWYLPFQWQTHLFPTHLRLDSLLFGVLLGYYYHFHRDRLSAFVTAHAGKVAGLGAMLILPAFLIGQYEPWMYTYGFTSLYLGYGCVAMAFLHARLPFASRPIVAIGRGVAYVGRFSYSIYLWHVPWLGVVGHIPKEDVGTRLFCFYAGSVLLGILAGKWIEFPALRLRERLFPRSAPERPEATKVPPQVVVEPQFQDLKATRV